MANINRRIIVALLCLLATLAPLSHANTAEASEPTSQAAPAQASRYNPIDPTRVLDTRANHGLSRLAGGVTYTLDLSAYLPVGTSAITANATVTNSSAALFVSLWPTGPFPGTSSINVSAANETLANLVTVPVSAQRTVHIYASADTDLLLDLGGFYTPSGATEAGRYRPINPVRVYDSRIAGNRQPISQNVIALNVSDLTGFTDSALVVTVTATDVTTPGYVSVLPMTGFVDMNHPPQTSSLNIVRVGQTVSNQVITKTNTGGSIVIAVAGRSHIVIDVIGMYTGGAFVSPESTEGLFVPISPTRVSDTRHPDLTPFGSPRPARPGESWAVGAAGITNATTVVGNITMTGNSQPGYLTVWEAGAAQPYVSTLFNDTPGSMFASHFMAAASGGNLAVYAPVATDAVIDITGYFHNGS